MSHCQRFTEAPQTRRQMLTRCANGFGAVALAALSADPKFAAAAPTRPGALNPFEPKKSHFPAQAKQIISRAFKTAGLTAPSIKDVLVKAGLDRKRAVPIVQILIKEKSLVRITEDLMFHQDALEDLRSRLTDLKKEKTTINVREFKNLAGVSRKYAIPLLEYLDREHVTRRQGNERLIL